MLSAKVLRVLEKHELTLSEGTTERDAWAKIAQHTRASASPRPIATFCFSGFTAKDSAQLSRRAKEAGFGVSNSIVKKTDYLCAGPLGAGPSKVEKALVKNVKLIDAAGFEHVIATGELI